MYVRSDTGFLPGVQHQSLVRGNAPRKRGIYIGKVVDITSKGIVYLFIIYLS